MVHESGSQTCRFHDGHVRPKHGEASDVRKKHRPGFYVQLVAMRTCEFNSLGADEVVGFRGLGAAI